MCEWRWPLLRAPACRCCARQPAPPVARGARRPTQIPCARGSPACHPATQPAHPPPRQQPPWRASTRPMPRAAAQPPRRPGLAAGRLHLPRPMLKKWHPSGPPCTRLTPAPHCASQGPRPRLLPPGRQGQEGGAGQLGQGPLQLLQGPRRHLQRQGRRLHLPVSDPPTGRRAGDNAAWRASQGAAERPALMFSRPDFVVRSGCPAAMPLSAAGNAGCRDAGGCPGPPPPGLSTQMPRPCLLP